MPRRLTFAPLKTMYPEAAEAARGGPLDPKAAAAAKKAKAGGAPASGKKRGAGSEAPKSDEASRTKQKRTR
jgi:hypothetical protein